MIREEIEKKSNERIEIMIDELGNCEIKLIENKDGM